MTYNKPKPDDRSDNAAKLKDMVQNTIENIEEAEESLQFSNAEQKAQIEQKNDRRRESIQGMREEIQDESGAQENNYH